MHVKNLGSLLNYSFFQLNWKFKTLKKKKRERERTSWNQWLRLCAPHAGGPDSVPGQETRKTQHAATKTEEPCDATKTCHSQIEKYLFLRDEISERRIERLI